MTMTGDFISLQGWQVFQDHYDMGEEYEIYLNRMNPLRIQGDLRHGAGMQPDEWQALPFLGHLQTILSEDPNYGPEMRLYNAAPWWYRNEFPLPAGAGGKGAVLRFAGVDYFCKVWLNGRYLGEHEGYTTPFEFEVGDLLGESNHLYVKVWSPPAYEKQGGRDEPRCLHVVRDMMKGTYEHGDSLIHRDRNPVGIWREVTLTTYEEMRFVGKLQLRTRQSGEVAEVRAAAIIRTTVGAAGVAAELSIADAATGMVVCRMEQQVELQSGDNEVVICCTVENPRLWNTWDRGEPNLYIAKVTIAGITHSERFGIREARIDRTAERTTYYLNGHRLYIRGCSYYPETYLSYMHPGRYRRDMEALIRAGCNMVRVHVHEDKSELYDICDELGLAVMQDTDFNWVHPCTEQWAERACKIFAGQIRDLYNHPSILTWVCLNEPVSIGQPEMGCEDPQNPFMYRYPGPQLQKLAWELDPDRPIIRGSFCENDPDSGDSHNYRGSIYGHDTHYTIIDGTTEKFNTEFGFDAPPCKESLWRERRIYRRLGEATEDIEALQYYQYRYLKYFIEHYRLQKYAPNSGYIQFMFIDCSPSVYYGVYDWWGDQKPGLKAFYESSQPLGVFMNSDRGLVVVNDFAHGFAGCELQWNVTDEMGNPVCAGSTPVEVQPDSRQDVACVEFAPDDSRRYTVYLTLTNAAGRRIAHNVYEDPFHHPQHPEGHPQNFSHQWGLRLYRGE